MDILQAIILGILQGATEFIPVSSSGHLVLLPWWLGWSESPSLLFSVAVHLGTLLAVLVYFRQDWLHIAGGAIHIIRTRRANAPASQLFLLLVAGSIPVAIVGFFLADTIEAALNTPAMAALFLLITALLLTFSEWKTGASTTGKTIEQAGFLDATIIGIAQLLALFPGISRSGSTIAVGMVRGMTRTDAARFSFLLGTPAILGAGLLTGIEYLQSPAGQEPLSLLIAGFVSAAIIGYVSIAFLLSHLRQHRLYLFAVYCTVAGLGSLLAVAFGR